MPYFPDLSPYSYLPRYGCTLTDVRNVGWLDPDYPFPTGPVPEGTIERLLALAEFHKVQPTRGFHICRFCPASKIAQPFRMCQGRKVWLGTAEICVVSNSGKAYAAPTLFIHYVEAHHYRPPDEFLKALFEMQIPDPA